MSLDSVCVSCEHKSYCKMCDTARSATAIRACHHYAKSDKKTNADRIRAMTDEELAEFIGKCVDHEFHIECSCFLKEEGHCYYPRKGCDEIALEWLKQEATK